MTDFYSRVHGRANVRAEKKLTWIERMYYKLLHRTKAKYLEKPWMSQHNHVWRQDHRMGYQWMRLVRVHPSWIDQRLSEDLSSDGIQWMYSIVWQSYSWHAITRWAQVLASNQCWEGLNIILPYTQSQPLPLHFWSTLQGKVSNDDLIYLTRRSRQSTNHLPLREMLSQMSCVEVLQKFMWTDIDRWVIANEWEAPLKWWKESLTQCYQDEQTQGIFRGIFMDDMRQEFASFAAMKSPMKLQKDRLVLMQKSPFFHIMVAFMHSSPKLIGYGLYTPDSFLKHCTQETIDADYILANYFQYTRKYKQEPSAAIASICSLITDPVQAGLYYLNSLEGETTEVIELEGEFTF